MEPSQRCRAGDARRGGATGRLAIALILALAIVGCRQKTPPETPRKPVQTTQHGVTIVDDYQWLEKSEDPAVRKWTDQQNKYSRYVLDQVRARPFIEERLKKLLGSSAPEFSAVTTRQTNIFALETRPEKAQPILVTLASLGDAQSHRVLVDPTELDASGATTIDWYVPSHRGNQVVVSTIDASKDEEKLFLCNTETGTRTPIGPGGSLSQKAGAAWNQDDTGFFYFARPTPAQAAVVVQQWIYFHGISGGDEKYEIGKEFPAAVKLSLQSHGNYVLAAVAKSGGAALLYLRSQDGKWKQITQSEDNVKQAEFGRDPLYIELPRDDALYLLSFKGAARGKILRMPLDQAEFRSAEEVVREGRLAVKQFVTASSGLFIDRSDGGPSDLRYFDFVERRERKLPLKGTYAIEEMFCRQGDDLYFRMASFTEASSWATFDSSRDRDRIHPVAPRAPAEFADVEVLREFVKSKGGARVPLNIVKKKGLRLDGHRPTLLTGYGAYGVSLAPQFDITRRLWLDQDGIIAIANLRGGSEYGEEWRLSGNLTNKQNTVDDLIACAHFLIRSNYTSHEKLALEAHGTAATLVGAAMAAHPELFDAVVSSDGRYDLLRPQHGAEELAEREEFGATDDADQFATLLSSSPYQQITNQAGYPAVLLLAQTGQSDARKMTARLQATNNSSRPKLLRTSARNGRGIDTILKASLGELTDALSFLFEQLGVEYSLVDRGPWSGGITPTSATVKTKLAQPGLQARLIFGTDPDLKQAQKTKTVTTSSNQNDVVEFPLTKLKPNTTYYYALEVNGRIEKQKAGELRTFPEGASSFTFAFASCAKTESVSDVFDRIRENKPLFYMNMGDFHYLNITTNSRTRFRDAYDLVLSSPTQSDLYRHIPFVYIWDDHDFGGNNSNRRASSHEAARLTYEEYVPHYPLASGEGDVPIYQTFSVGRAKFILTDLRSERDSAAKRDTPEKTMMGAKQKAWFKQQLLEANGKYPLIFWMSTVPWLGHATSNYYRGIPPDKFGFIHHTNLHPEALRSRPRLRSDEDHWSVYSYERREIANFIKSNHISGVCILHGDSHMLAADDGSHSDFATGGGAPIPVMCAAPLDQEPSIKGGPSSQGIYKVRKGEGCFGLVSVVDNGNDIEVTYSGRNNRNQEKIHLSFTVPVMEKPRRPPRDS